MARSSMAAQVVRQARLRKGLSQSALAQLAGTTQSAISRLERGGTVPSFDRVAELVAAMGLRLEAVLVEQDVDDAAVERNLRLSYQDRWANAINAVRFVQRGREVMDDGVRSR